MSEYKDFDLLGGLMEERHGTRKDYVAEINKLRAEIERLKDELDCTRLTASSLQEVCDGQTSEIERLKSEMLFVPVFPCWIPVSERLPNRDGFYLILENVNQVAGYYHWCKQFGWNTDGGRIHIQTVTHWMPLPTPPEDEL